MARRLNEESLMSHPSSQPSPWKDRAQRASRFAFIGFAAIAAFFLITEHGAHLFGWLPFLILLACPFLHMFGHGGHQHDSDRSEAPARSPSSSPPAAKEDSTPGTSPTQHHH
jgi:hypothetical protein